MSLPDFDTRKAMSPLELDDLYRTELEAILATVEPAKAARYRAMIGGKIMSLERIKSPYMRADQANRDMMESFKELTALLTQFKEVTSNEKI